MFLDEVSTDVLHVSGAARRLTQSHGNYSLWAKRRATQQTSTNTAPINNAGTLLPASPAVVADSEKGVCSHCRLGGGAFMEGGHVDPKDLLRLLATL